MIEEKQLIKSCFYYEMFMERAFGRITLQKPNMQASGMRNLMVAENQTAVSFESVMDFEEQLIEIKKNMEDALDQYMAKSNLPRYILEELSLYKDQVVWAVSSDELMKIVHDTINLTNILLLSKQ